MVCYEDGHRKIDAKVIELSVASSIDPALFTPPAGAMELGNCSSDLVPPKGVTTTFPRFPPGMQDRQALVTLWMIVDIKGNPQNLKIVQSGGKHFDEAAMATVRGWRFWPATCGGEPMPMAINVEIPFRGYW
jgi:TonB family protein